MADLVRVEVPRLPPRTADSHKGTFGRVLVVAGSRGMSGAAVLCGSAALRGGAGLVTVACPTDIQDVVAAGNPCYTTHAIAIVPGTTQVGTELAWRASSSDVLAVGPGLGGEPHVRHLVRAAFGLRDKPLVLDADGLNAVSLIADPIGSRPAATVFTPHPGEFARLVGKSITEVQANRELLSVEFARAHRIVMLLKGHRTLVTDGTRVYTNETGNPGMATGGSGDVLTGLIAALIGQGLSGFEAAVLGAWVHGRAGDLAAAEKGQTGLIATDILACLPNALLEVGP